MPDLEEQDLEQTAVLWRYLGVDKYGAARVGDPEEISVRWLTRRTESVDSRGNPIALDATVVVDQEIKVGSQIWLGELADYYGTGSEGEETEVMYVRNYSETPDIRNRAARRTVGLSKHMDEPSNG